MAPTPQEVLVTEEKVRRPAPGEEVVISGMSGIFPKSDSVQQFMDNLYNKVNMVTSEDPRWVFNHPEVPKHLGKVNGMGKFDAQFFRVHFKQACTMEPMSRKLLEHAYSAIYDSGINPLQLRGKKVGVFIGSTFSESEKIVIYENVQRNGFGITGCNKAMYANRISYWIDGKGPSYSLDLACASSAACLEHAYKSISSGQCDAAIVGGCNLCMHPNVSLHCRRAGFVCLDGKTKCFDKNGDGYVRSDAISVLFVQKAKDAKRIYTEVYHAKANYSPASEQLMPIREPKELQQFLEAFYSEIGLSPEEVEYIEANGAAVPEADSNELKAIAEVFGKKNPVKIGCVKSNMGSSEPASGVCGITKVCLAYHNGKLPGNLHYEDPLEIPEVKNKIQVLTDTQKFGRGFAALNSFSYSGANVHVLLKGRYKPKDPQRYKSSVPHLVLASGRQDSCVNRILETLKKSPLDPEQIALFHNIHLYDTPGHMSRGYTILDKNEEGETISLSQNVEYYSGTTRPVWFVYSGMGSQWATMGAELMRIPIFSAAIQKCHKVLEPKGIDIVKILTDPDKTIYDNILHSFVGIAAVQIGLTDILTELGVVPDHIIGHSVGELGCAYADGCFTAEEMILAAYSRGLVSIQTPFIRGSMAAVGMGYKTVLPLCPPEIEVACHNSSESSTISGPSDVMKQFVSELTSQGIFAKEVPCSNIAYHSRYIAEAGPGLLKYLSEVIKTPKERSSKWMSTSVPTEKWNEPIAKYSSAEYHTNNLLNSVLFEETSKLIPPGALLIEIAPHGLLQAILKRSLPDCVHVPLTRRGTSDPVKFLLESFGKLYQEGLNLKIDALYPKIEFPVSTETPFLSQYVEWEHSEDWPQAKYNNKDRVVATVRDFVMSVFDDDFNYFKGHMRNGKCVFPESAFLVLAWETLAMYKGVANYKNLSVLFEDVRFHGEAIITPELPVRLQIMIFKGNNKFEVTYDDFIIVSGYISVANTQDADRRQLNQREDNSDNVLLSSNDVYTLLNLRGYGYKDEFKSIHSSTSSRNNATIKWNDNWITYLDGLLQLNAFANDFKGICVPSHVKKLKIDVEKHARADLLILDDYKCVKAERFDLYEHTKSGGVELEGLYFKNIPRVEQSPDVLLSKTFVPHFLTGGVTMKTALQVNLQIICENVVNTNVHIANLVLANTHDVSKTISEVTDEVPSHEFTISFLKDKSIEALIGTSDLVITDNLLGEEKRMKEIYKMISKNSFILSMEQDTTKIHPQYKLFSVVTAMTVQKQILLLLRKVDRTADENIKYIPIVHDTNFSWTSQVETEIMKSRKIVLVSERQSYCGLLGMVKELRKEYGNKIGLIVVDDYHVPSFNPEKDIFKGQLEKNLAINVFVKGQWGGYYNLDVQPKIPLKNICLASSSPGNMDDLIWKEQSQVTESDNQIQVCFAGASNKDAKVVTGKTFATEQVYGMDFSGINDSGKKVMGIVSGGAIASKIEADPDLLWPVPDYWTLEDAATVPLAYAQAYYCLTMKSSWVKDSTILINGGAGALGQALIAVALSMQCKVYVTVCNAKQKEFLMKIFPELPGGNIGRSPLVMKQKIIKDMKIPDQNYCLQRRCDVVVNCLSGTMRKNAMKCIGPFGDFLDFCDYEMLKNEDFGMQFLMGATSYLAVNINSIFKSQYSKEKKILHQKISEGIASGVVRPLSRVLYSPNDVTRAFRLLSGDRNIGQVLIRMEDVATKSNILNVTARVSYSSKGSYIVVCDDTAVGMELADRLVSNGVRNLIIHTRPNSIAGYCYMKLLSWSKLKVSTQLSSENLQTEKGCVNLLTEGAKLAPVRGIFIVQKLSGAQSSGLESVGAKFNNTAGVVANLDLATRNICKELEHFVVVNHSIRDVSGEYIVSATDNICRLRNEVSLPALALHVATLKEFEDSELSHPKLEAQSLSALFTALDTSIKYKQTNVVTYNLKKNHAKEFLQVMAKIIGVNSIADLHEDWTLKDLQLNEVSLGEVSVAIKNAYQISYPDEKLALMTVADLKNLEHKVSRTVVGKESGLGAFITYIDRDECLAAEPVVTLPTSYSSVTEEEELDPKATYLMLVPGFEGHHQVFTTLSERLKVQALTFQLVPDMPSDSIPQIAANIAKFTKKRLELKSKFYLLGYSFGVNVAMELATIFEKEGLVGVVYCLDSSPDALRAQLDAYLGNLTDSQLQNAIIQHMYQLMSGHHSPDLEKELQAKDTWNDKVELCVNKLRGFVNYSHQYKRCLLKSAYKRIILAKDYKPAFKLESELILMKGLPHPTMVHLPEDYNLPEYTTKPVKVFQIDSDHASAYRDCKVANIVNRLLEPKLLEEFKNKNLCWTYLADPVKTW